MLAEGGANVIMRLSGRKLKKIDFACRSTAKNKQKNAFFRFFQKCTRSPLYIKKARRMCLGHPKSIFPAIYRPYDHLK